MPALGSTSFVKGLTERKEQEETEDTTDGVQELLSEKEEITDSNEVTDEYLMTHKEPLTPLLRVLLFFRCIWLNHDGGMDQSLLTTAEIFAKPYLHISSAHWSWVASAFSLATAWGTLFAIPVGEFLGRKRALQISAALCFTGGIMQTAANTFPVLLAGRLLLGLGMGLEAMNIPIYLAECAPAYGKGGHLNFFFQLVSTIWSSNCL
ncbi:Probable polyol transporter 4 [Galdieria sulphuraria]|nr:Probable polyol transporter 4 [Galdieria sulphuraria]